MSDRRFLDEGTILLQFMEKISVVCSRCQEHALVLCQGYPDPDHKPARIICRNCGFNEENGPSSWKGPMYGRIKTRCPHCRHLVEKELTNPKHLAQTQLTCPKCGSDFQTEISWLPDSRQAALDPFFGLPLWYVGPVKGHQLWALNREHLTFLKQVVSADLRQQTPNQNRTLSNRLPKWMLDRKNRSAVLKAIEKLEKLVP